MDFKKQCAIFIDIDGTLIGSSDEALKKNFETINKVRKLGHKVFINTGRSTAYVPSLLNINTNFDGLIAGSGTYVRIGETEVFKKTVPYDTVKRLSDYFMKRNVPGILEGELAMYHFSGISYKKDDWICLDKKSITELIKEDTPIQKFSIYGTAPADLADYLGEDYLVLQHNGYAEITLRGYSKAAGIETAICKLGIPREQTIAIGDSMNDIEMMEYSDFAIAMENAVDRIKAVADLITDHVNNAGVATALEHIFL